jgi:saccharopine dehydrogenase (NADP+, L-glutamate forming)
MKKILVLGAGLVAGPLVKYLLDREEGIAVTVADMDFARAETLVRGRPNGEAKALSVTDREAVAAEAARADLIVSMVPYTLHPLVAEVAVGLGKSLVTASYVSPAMRALDDAARGRGVLLLNEMGLDPGIDHMEAMRIIHETRQKSGQVLSFTSYCGGLPAPESNTNPFGYKFSWSPRGVLLASRNSARFLKDGAVVTIPGEKLFDSRIDLPIPGLGVFEGYPNRDSVPYGEIYGIPESRTILRGTLRYPGWCETMKRIGEIGLLDDAERPLSGRTYGDLVAELAGIPAPADLRGHIAAKVGLETDSGVLDRLEWLGLFGADPLPIEKGSPLDVLAARMIEKLSYGPGERDMIVLQHEFLVRYPDGRLERIVSTLVDYGIPDGDSSMSRTVGLPVAIAAKLILEGRISRTGVLVPVVPEIYVPVLEELETLGVRFSERRQSL